nr:response regulator [Desulfogranum marinum]
MHVQHTPLAVIEWNLDFQIVEWNKAAEVIFGFSRDEAMGKTPFELLVPEEEKEQLSILWKKISNQKGSIRQINTNLTKDKKIKTCEWFNTPLLNSQGDFVGVASLALDITDRIKAEQTNKMLREQLLQSQKMEAIGNLAGGISHDFNNLLQGISGYTQLMLTTCDPTSKNYSHLQGILQACERAADLIRQLLTLSRKVESALGPLNLNEQVTQVRTILDHTIPKMIDIKIDLAPNLHTINADPIQIEQIILNMAINAHQAMPDGGTLSISTANTCLDAAFCAKHLQATQGPNVMLKIADNGPGMDQAILERIFEPFFTTKEVGQGTGLGLSTVYGIIQSHGAYIQCVSSPGKGTEFTIYFPAIVRQHERPKKPQKEDVDLGGNETVLIVDDEAIVREIAAEILTTHGYATLLAESGEEAIRIYAANKNTIDIVIMDLNMPGMGGFNSIRKLKALDPNVCILVASGYIPTESVKRATELGADGFISKPFQMINLLKKIRKTLAIAKQTTT